MRVSIVANLKRHDEIPSRHWYRTDRNVFHDLGHAAKLAGSLRQAGAPDLYVSWWAARSAPVVLLARLLGRRSIVVAGGTDSARSPASLPGHPFFYDAKPFWIRFLVRLALRYSDAVIAVSRSTAADLHALGARKICWIPNCIDTLVFHPPKQPCEPSFPTLVTVCNMDREACVLKGLDIILDAFQQVAARCPTARLVLIGALGSGYPDARKRAAELGVASRVVFTGRLANEDVAEWFRAASVFVSATRYETFGVAIAEAMACGLPVVVPRLPAVEEVVGAEGVFVESDDPACFAAQILDLLADSSLRADLGRAASARISKHFSLSVRRDAFRRLLEELNLVLLDDAAQSHEVIAGG